MNDVIFTSSRAPLTEEDISRFEKKLRIKLPPKYRRFLLRVNGGIPHKPMAEVCYVQTVHAITDADDNLSLEQDIAIMRDDLPSELIPIIYAGGGDRVCVSLKDDKLYLWEHEIAYEPHPPRVKDLTLVAEHVDDLLEHLTGDDPPVPDEEVQNIGRWGQMRYLDEYLAKGHDINEVTARGHCIVNSAVWGRQLEFLKECVKRGAALKGRGLLHAAAFTMEVELVKYLLEQGLDPNELDERGETPLDCVMRPSRNGPAAKLLEKAGGVRTADEQ